jgi:hypothetical protein
MPPSPRRLSIDAVKSSWDFGEGDEIAPGRQAVSLLGGGRRY